MDSTKKKCGFVWKRIPDKVCETSVTGQWQINNIIYCKGHYSKMLKSKNPPIKNDIVSNPNSQNDASAKNNNSDNRANTNQPTGNDSIDSVPPPTNRSEPDPPVCPLHVPMKPKPKDENSASVPQQDEPEEDDDNVEIVQLAPNPDKVIEDEQFEDEQFEDEPIKNEPTKNEPTKNEQEAKPERPVDYERLICGYYNTFPVLNQLLPKESRPDDYSAEEWLKQIKHALQRVSSEQIVFFGFNHLTNTLQVFFGLPGYSEHLNPSTNPTTRDLLREISIDSSFTDFIAELSPEIKLMFLMAYSALMCKMNGQMPSNPLSRPAGPSNYQPAFNE